MLEGKERELMREMICHMSMGRITPAILKKFDEMTDDVARGLIKNYLVDKKIALSAEIKRLQAEYNGIE
jgi:hypothetical protein